jgi:hypothetical protein
MLGCLRARQRGLISAEMLFGAPLDRGVELLSASFCRNRSMGALNLRKGVVRFPVDTRYESKPG